MYEMRSVLELFTGIKEQFGRLDILVNNAAINPQFCNVLDTEFGALQKPWKNHSRSTAFFISFVDAGKLSI